MTVLLFMIMEYAWGGARSLARGDSQSLCEKMIIRGSAARIPQSQTSVDLRCFPPHVSLQSSKTSRATSTGQPAGSKYK